MLQDCLEDLEAGDFVALDFYLDRTHEADKHGAISQAVQCARLRQENLQDFHENLVVEQVDPEASLDCFLHLIILLCVKDALKGDLHWPEPLMLQSSQLKELFLKLWNRFCFGNFLLEFAENCWIKDLCVKINQLE